MTAARSMTQFTVQGRDPFPMDMLRYDACWPSDTGSALAIGWSHSHDPDRLGTHKITMNTWKVGITPERWGSFGWTVISQERV
jgi:hypothetical protein